MARMEILKLGEVKVFSHFLGIPLLLFDKNKAPFLYTFSVTPLILQKKSGLENQWIDGWMKKNLV